MKNTGDYYGNILDQKKQKKIIVVENWVKNSLNFKYCMN